jgi:hypothetical protein
MRKFYCEEEDGTLEEGKDVKGLFEEEDSRGDHPKQGQCTNRQDEVHLQVPTVLPPLPTLSIQLPQPA